MKWDTICIIVLKGAYLFNCFDIAIFLFFILICNYSIRNSFIVNAKMSSHTVNFVILKLTFKNTVAARFFADNRVLSFLAR